ncbi:hypothetical protein SCA6_019856 [Theobroma cacao]
MVRHQVILQLQSLTHQQKNFLASHGYLRFCSLSKVKPSFQLYPGAGLDLLQIAPGAGYERKSIHDSLAFDI